MNSEPLPKRLFDGNNPIAKPIFNLKRGRGHSKISAILVIWAVVVATALTFLLLQSTLS